MSFLAPFFLLGALAIALPIVFHLIRRTSREKMPFSSLMFLMPTPPRVTRRSRLENIFLLILRCLVLCLLALGFARPFLQKPLAADPQSGQGKKIVLLVDTSASMRRENLWPEAQAKVDQLLRKTSPVDKVAVLTFDRQVRTLVSFEEWSSMALGERAALSSKRLEEIKPGWSDTHLGSALIHAAEVLEESSKQEQLVKQIVLISDFQEGSRLEGLQGYEWPRGLELVVEPVKAKRPTNAGLQLITDRDETYQGSAADVLPRIRVSNAADSKREQFQIGWAVPGTRKFTGTPVDVYVPPGQGRIVSARKDPSGGMELVLTGDEEEFDNSVYFASPKADEVNLLFLGSDSEKDPSQSLYYLLHAFQQTRRQLVRITARAPAEPLLATNLESAPLMIVTDPLSEERSKAVKQFLSGGKTVLFTMKTPEAAASLARLLEIENLPAAEASASTYAMLGQIDFEHPLFAPFADPRYSDFTKIHFWKHRRLATDKLPGARILARFDNGDPALIQIPVGKGTLLVLTSGWHPADSQLALSSKFVPLLYSIVEQSGGIKAHKSQYFVGDVVALTGTAQPITVRKPDGSEVTLTGTDTFSETDLPGIYSVTPNPWQFSVNLAAEESKTAPMPLEEFERLGVPIRVPSLPPGKLVEQRRQHLQAVELENRQKLWRWLILVALLVLVTETWLAGWLTRRAATGSEAQTG